jgi:hypothetical protein
MSLRRKPSATPVEITNSFIAILHLAVDFLEWSDLREVSESDSPYNPIRYSTIKTLAAKQAFDSFLETKLVNWTMVKSAASEICSQLKTAAEKRQTAAEDTRYFPWNAQWVAAWKSAWASRNLEQILSFFSDDAEYDPGTGAGIARGKTAIRTLLGKLQHKWRTSVESVSIGSRDAVELKVEWVRSVPRSTGRPDEHVEIHGHSILKTEDNRYHGSSLRVKGCWDRFDCAELPNGCPLPYLRTPSVSG